MEGDSGKENTPRPTVMEDESEEEERLRKEMNMISNPSVTLTIRLSTVFYASFLS